MQKLKRFLSLVLVVSMFLGMAYIAPFAFAANFGRYDYNPSASEGKAFVGMLIDRLASATGVTLPTSAFGNIFSETGLVSSLRRLLSIATEYNNQTLGGKLNRPLGDFNCIAEVDYDGEHGIYRLKDRKTDRWLCDSNGRFPYFECDIPDDIPAWALIPSKEYPSSPELAASSSNRWLELAPIQTKLNSGVLSGDTTYSYEQLHDLLFVLRADNPTTNYRLAPVFGGSYGVCRNNLILCDQSGKPFIAFPKKESSVTNQYVNNIVQDKNGNAVIIQGENVTTDKPVIDQSNLELNIPVTDNSSSVSIEDFIHQDIYNTSYNFDDHSYTVNTYDVTYNNDNRRYETNYYTWNITYNITNTYVTYIGSNDAYQQKEYEFYYELPDGRSSADLTADEVAAMSFQFADCMNYQRSATDTNLRALYHFDGDLSDSGYFSDKTAFTWKSGASITYMDSSTFDGALYLDDTAHSFDIMLSRGINPNSDFSVQFRYYQASEPDTASNIENSLSLNGTAVLKWDERRLYKGGTELCLLPLGNWIELALIKHSGTLYFYLNGVKVNTLSVPTSALRTLSFDLGSTSRAYSMLDELRVIDFAVVAGGANYTPTAVPYDTNLVLTLPGQEAVVDDYWQYTSPNNLIARPLFTDDGDYSFLPSSRSPGVPYFYNVSSSSYSYEFTNSCLTVTSHKSTGYDYGTSVGGSTYVSPSFAVDLKSSSSSSISGYYYNSPFTFSIVTPGGDIFSYSSTFLTTSSLTSLYSEFDWGRIYYCRYSTGCYVTVVPAPGQSISIAYVEVVLGSSAQVVADHIVSSYDLSTLKPNTAAVQTDIPIHGYTVGGVRPTFPVRGDVWFGVTNGRVSTVQVYTGSAWTSSNARWWTGTRWIPIYAFDIFTLEDCWDIADGDDVITPIESDTAGWNWWKKAWTDFRSWLGGVFGGETPVEPSPSPSPSPSPGGPVIDDRPLMLAPGVSIIRENADTWEANNAASVTVSLERGDLWSSSNTVKNLFVVDLMHGATSDDLFVSLDVDGLPVNEYPQWDVVSFLLYGNDDNYASVRKASHFAGFSTAVETFGSLVEHDGSADHNAVTSATFALYKKGNQIRVFVCPSGGSWQEGETLTADFTVNKIGFCGWRYNDRGQTVTFSNLRMSTASRYDLVKDADTMLTSFMANTPVIPFFLGGGFEVLPGAEPAGPDSAPRPSAGPLVDDDGSEVSVWDLPAKLFDGLWGLLSGLFGVVAGGVNGLFSLVGDGVGGFFGAFSGDDGVFQFVTYGGADIWD